MNRTQPHEISEPITSIHYEKLRQFGKAYQLDIRGLVKLRHNLQSHIESYTRLLLRNLQQKHGVIKPHMIQQIGTFNDALEVLDHIDKDKQQWEALLIKRDALKLQTYLLEKSVQLRDKPSPGTSLLALFKDTLNWQNIPDKGCLLELYKNDHHVKYGSWGRTVNKSLTDIWTQYLDKSFIWLKNLLPRQSYIILEDMIMDLFQIEAETYAGYFNIETQKLYDLKNRHIKEHKETIDRAWRTFKTSPKYADRYSPYIPSNEQGVVFLFGRLHELLGFEDVVLVQTRYPDCVAIRNGNEVRIEFEFKSSGFLTHTKNGQVQDGDICVCWENDYNLPIETIELKSFLFE